MGINKHALLGGIMASMAFGGVAFAADLPVPPVIEHMPEYQLEHSGSWYLRGDIGYDIYGEPNATYYSGGVPAVWFIDEEFNGSFMAGIGIGYAVNDYMRADLTVDYHFGADFAGDTPTTALCAPNPVCSNEDATLSYWTVMANIYADLGTWYSITPYVGAGAGMAYMTLGDWRSTTPATAIVDNSDWGFAWSLMAGLSMDVSDSGKIDLGYRFLDLGEVESGYDGATTNFVNIDNLAVHEVRLGYRHYFH